MAFPGISMGGAVELTVMGTYNDVSELANVYQFQVTDAPVTTEADLLQDMEEIVVVLYELLEWLFYTAVVWDRFKVRILNDLWASGVVSLGTPVPGVNTDGIGPAGVAALCFFPLGDAGRQLRKYLGPLTPSAVSPTTGALDTGATAAIAPYLTALQVPYEATNHTWRYGYARFVGDTFATPVSGVVSAQPAYQRRRKVGVGV